MVDSVVRIHQHSDRYFTKNLRGLAPRKTSEVWLNYFISTEA